MLINVIINIWLLLTIILLKLFTITIFYLKFVIFNNQLFNIFNNKIFINNVKILINIILTKNYKIKYEKNK